MPHPVVLGSILVSSYSFGSYLYTRNVRVQGMDYAIQHTYYKGIVNLGAGHWPPIPKNQG